MYERIGAMKMIWAVVRSSKVDAIAQALKSIGVSGCTVYPVRGYGEEWHVYQPLVHGGHHKLEVIIEDRYLESAVSEISKQAWTGIEGDGILTLFDLSKVVLIRREKAR
jgi:nitrogen regulatory protein PII